MTITEMVAPWMALHEALGIGVPIRDEGQYEQVVKFAESLADELPDDAGDPRWGLVHLLADRIKEYEDRVNPMPKLPAHELLRELMEEHGLGQKDLPEVGTQSVISDVLTGKRKLNLRQVRALAQRFGLPMEVFADDAV